MITETDVKIETPSFCDECGAPIPPGSRFCTKCGKAVYIPEPEPPVETSAAPAEEPQEAAVTVSEPAPEPVVPTSVSTPEPAVPAIPPEPAAPPVPSAAPEVKAAKAPKAKKEKKPKQAMGAVSTVLTFLLCALLIPCILLFMVLLMIRILFPDLTIPTMAGIDGAVLTSLANALYPLIASVILIVLLLALVIVLNRKQFRRVFLALGLSILILSLLIGLGGVFANTYVAPFQLDASLAREYIVFFRELNLIFSTICTGVGLFFTAIYLCVAAAKKKDA